MSNPIFAVLDIPNDAPVVLPAVVQALAGSGAAFDLGGATDKGFDITLDGAATFVGSLEASVTGKDNWAIISAIATQQGAIAARYNFVRVTVANPGVYGDDTIVRVAGKERG